MSVPRHLRQPKDPYRPPKRAVSVASSARTPVYQRGRPQHTTSHLPSAETITKPKRKELPSKPRSTSKPKTPVYQSTRPRHTTSHLPSAESTARREELPSETRSTSIKSRSAKTPVKSPRSRRTPEIRSQLAPWGTSAEVCFQDAPPLNPAFLESTSSQVEKSVEKPSKSPRRSPRRKKRKRKDRHGDLKKTGSYLDLTSKYAVAGRKQKQKSSSTAPSSQDKLSSGTPSGVSGELSLEISTKDMPTSATEASQKSTASEPKFIFKVHKPRKGERKPSKKKYKESGKRETDHKLVEKSESDLSQTDQPEEDERKQTRLPQKLDYVR
ncbi:hypothetical protein V3C99_005492 [Haemonchus contortus]